MLATLVISTANAMQLRRDQVLLWLDEGDSVEEVGQRLFIKPRTIYT